LLAARSPELVRKLVMIGTPPLQEPWADVVTNERIRRLSPCESAEFKRLVDFFNGCPDHDSDAERARLGELAAKADAYDEVSAVTDDPAAPSGIAVARMFSRVWREAVALRRSGDLVKEGNRIRCPVVAIHGDHDPHPVEGVRQPAAEVLADFRLVLLERCGHTPWRERHASDLLFRTLQREIVKAGADHEKEAHDDRHRDT
jgi:pimeloyl-ACP methyl ester carboxylesterase